MDELAILYVRGVSIREIARKKGMCFQTVRHRLIRSGLLQVKHKRFRYGLATCNRCSEAKDSSQFPKLLNGTYLCELCLRAAEEEWQLRRQGASSEQYRRLLEVQDGTCAICGATEGHRSKNGKVCRLAVDHDHRTGKVRGLLCNSCNRGLGRFKDSIENLESAIRYLQREQ